MEGVFPRVNGAMIQSGQCVNNLVSLVGKYANGKLECADHTFVTINHDMVPPPDHSHDMVLECMGQVDPEGKLMLFVVRPLSLDMDLDLYNKMIQVQQKFPQYFAPPPQPIAGE